MNVPSCSLSCGDAPRVGNGYVLKQSFQNGLSVAGSTASYSCFDGFTVQGNPVIRCQSDGTWTTAPTCGTAAAFCSGIPTVEDGHEKSRTFNTLQALAGDQMTFACDAGFRLQGTSTVSCLDSGVWSSPPTCNIDFQNADSCGEAPNAIPNGRMERKTYQGRPSVPGDAAYYICDNGYAIFGLNTAYCNKNSQWSRLPQCVRTCGPVPKISNGYIMWQNFTSTLPSQPGDAARYSCSSGYGIEGRDEIVCTSNGQWSAKITCQAGIVNPTRAPKHQVFCPAAPAIANGGVVVTSYFGRNPVSRICFQKYHSSKFV